MSPSQRATDGAERAEPAGAGRDPPAARRRARRTARRGRRRCARSSPRELDARAVGVAPAEHEPPAAHPLGLRHPRRSRRHRSPDPCRRGRPSIAGPWPARRGHAPSSTSSPIVRPPRRAGRRAARRAGGARPARTPRTCGAAAATTSSNTSRRQRRRSRRRRRRAAGRRAAARCRCRRGTLRRTPRPSAAGVPGVSARAQPGLDTSSGDHVPPSCSSRVARPCTSPCTACPSASRISTSGSSRRRAGWSTQGERRLESAQPLDHRCRGVVVEAAAGAVEPGDHPHHHLVDDGRQRRGVRPADVAVAEGVGEGHRARRSARRRRGRLGRAAPELADRWPDRAGRSASSARSRPLAASRERVAAARSTSTARRRLSTVVPCPASLDDRTDGSVPASPTSRGTSPRTAPLLEVTPVDAEGEPVQEVRPARPAGCAGRARQRRRRNAASAAPGVAGQAGRGRAVPAALLAGPARSPRRRSGAAARAATPGAAEAAFRRRRCRARSAHPERASPVALLHQLTSRSASPWGALEEGGAARAGRSVRPGRLAWGARAVGPPGQASQGTGTTVEQAATNRLVERADERPTGLPRVGGTPLDLALLGPSAAPRSGRSSSRLFGAGRPTIPTSVN